MSESGSQQNPNGGASWSVEVELSLEEMSEDETITNTDYSESITDSPVKVSKEPENKEGSNKPKPDEDLIQWTKQPEDNEGLNKPANEMGTPKTARVDIDASSPLNLAKERSLTKIKKLAGKRSAQHSPKKQSRRGYKQN
uniref:Uncharacterized protein n=1 Tax=Cacopsylla melanoneura TaxID=428564 RepID=A0A8D8ZCH0_9HEMI